MNRKFVIIMIIVALIPIVITAIAYPVIPNTIPTHFNSENIADAFGSKSSIWLTPIIMFMINIFSLIVVFFTTRFSKGSFLEVEMTKKLTVIVGIAIDFVALDILFATISYDENNPHNILGVTLVIGIFICVYCVLQSIKVARVKNRQ